MVSNHFRIYTDGNKITTGGQGKRRTPRRRVREEDNHREVNGKKGKNFNDQRMHNSLKKCKMSPSQNDTKGVA